MLYRRLLIVGLIGLTMASAITLVMCAAVGTRDPSSGLHLRQHDAVITGNLHNTPC